MSVLRGHRLNVEFQGSLHPEQQQAADAMLGHDTGVLAATTAFGKTVVAAWLIAQRGVNTLVLVHRRQLMEQWVDRLSAFLAYAAKTDRENWGRTEEGNRGAGCRPDSKPGPKRGRPR